MKRQRTRPVEELMAELQENAEYAEGVEKAKKTAAARAYEVASASMPILSALKGIGIDVASIPELAERFAPLSVEVVSILLDSLNRETDPMLQEQVVRALAAAAGPFDGSRLGKLFDSSDSLSLKWAIANTIAEAPPIGLDQWVAETLADEEHGKAREMLALAVARMLPSSTANALLQSIFQELPAHAAAGLAECGGEHELRFLKEHRSAFDGWKRREIEQAISVIERRLALQRQSGDE